MPEGRHECVTCKAVFSHARSLQVHIGRLHNPKATVPCPENCGKLFTEKHAIKKHLLSHRPEHEWPFVCLFCGKHMQTNFDLAKHLKTKLHVNDSRIPKAGTPEWKALIKRSEVLSLISTTQEAEISESKTYSLTKQGKGNSNIVVESALDNDFNCDNMKVEINSDDDNDSIPDFDPNDQPLS